MITSAEKTIKTADGASVSVQVWNGTVANLSLMALGSSAPEILLSVIEVATNDFYAGELGPSTIVGSAAFNLFVILAVCISALEPGETRRIDEMTVFGCTAFFSVFAYVLLYVFVVQISPNIIEVWEAAFTLIMFPVLLILAYGADCGWFNTMQITPEQHIIRVGEQRFGAHEVQELMKQVYALICTLALTHAHNVAMLTLMSLSFSSTTVKIRRNTRS